MEKKYFDEKNIEVIGAHSITEEAFKNLSEESIHENVCPSSNLNEIQVEGSNSIDQTGNDPISDCEKNEAQSDQKEGENKTNSDKKAIEISPDSKDLADETITGKKQIEIKTKPKSTKAMEAHSITEETFENMGVESTPEQISPKSNLNRFRGEVILFLDNVDKILEKDTYYCYSCGAEDWFDCDCSYSEYESKCEKKVAKRKNKIKDMANETKSGQKEIKVKPKPRNYACTFDECKSLFVTMKGLKRHKNSIHLNLRPFKCTECASTFTRKEIFQNHMNSIHLKLKPYECGQCSAAFSRKDLLKRHIKDVHLDLKPFKCSQCSTTFNKNSSLKNHFKKIHGK